MSHQTALIEKLRGGLIVSCQARPDSPFYGPSFMAAFARAAEMSGAVGLRVNGERDIHAVRSASSLPIIGINKQRTDEWPVYITPSLEAAREVTSAGAEIVARQTAMIEPEEPIQPQPLSQYSLHLLLGHARVSLLIQDTSACCQ